MRSWAGPVAFVDRPTADGRVLAASDPWPQRGPFRVARAPVLDGSTSESVGSVEAAWLEGRAVVAWGWVDDAYAGLDYGAEVGVMGDLRETSDDAGRMVVRGWVLGYVQLGPRQAWPGAWVRVAA